MFGFDGSTKGLEAVLTRYTNGQQKLTHKEIRSHARCLLNIFPYINISLTVKPEIEIMLVALSASGLPHYDRMALAKRIVHLLELSKTPKDNTNDFF